MRLVKTCFLAGDDGVEIPIESELHDLSEPNLRGQIRNDGGRNT
jgi:hypothetical protein